MKHTPLEPLSLAQATRSELAHALATAPPADPMCIAGFRYLGLSLGLPAWVDRQCAIDLQTCMAMKPTAEYSNNERYQHIISMQSVCNRSAIIYDNKPKALSACNQFQLILQLICNQLWR